MSGEVRGAVARETAYDAAPDDQRRGMWHIYITHPGSKESSRDSTAASTAPDHRPTVLFRVVDEPKWHQVYRGGCLGCDWEGEEHTKEGEAAEDAHDHAWPGWRDRPAVLSRPATAEYDKKSLNRWVASVRQAYPDGWLDHGGPIRTIRKDSRGMRNVPGRAPGGGYDMAAADYRAKKTGIYHDQQTLDMEFPS